MPRKRNNLALVRPFDRNSRRQDLELRDHVDGAAILGEITKELNALETIDEELENSVQEFTRDVFGEDGEVLRQETYKSTVLDKETIAIYHTRQAGRKTKIDTLLKMLNKILPDLKAVEDTNDLGGASERALLAFKNAAQTDDKKLTKKDNK
jgi:hypothetical protein